MTSFFLDRFNWNVEFLIQPVIWLIMLVFLGIKALKMISVQPIIKDAFYFQKIANFIINWAFWGVIMIGVSDTLLSFMRVEGFQNYFPFLEHLLISGSFRGVYIYYPMLVFAFFLALRRNHFSFVWLIFLVVIAELLIVIARFVFSYEQPFMGDLVRFWYAAMFLFASAHTLFQGGHVRVDVLYATFSDGKKNLVNFMGSIFLGIPLCWIILIMGMSGKTSIIISPIINFEASQSSFGLSVKYFMAGFLMIFAISMLAMFSAYAANCLSQLLGEKSDLKRFTDQSAH
ncbi:MAG: TRAP transporter small permease subunit [Pseudomonadota bacterium]